MPEDIPTPPAGYEMRMPPQKSATELVAAGRDEVGREVRLTPAAAEAWTKMSAQAERDGARLLLLSGFRSVERQTEIVQKKLSAGLSLDLILRVSAYPGHSEHHTGRAVDIGSPTAPHLTEAFATTAEFRWLEAHAAEFGFFMSYPRDNPHGIAYEPWHWKFCE